MHLMGGYHWSHKVIQLKDPEVIPQAMNQSLKKAPQVGPTAGLLIWTPKQCTFWWEIMGAIKGTI